MKNKIQKLNWRRISALFAAVVVMCSFMVFAVPCFASSVGNFSRVGYFSIDEDAILAVGSGVNVQLYGYNAVIPLGSVYRIQIYDDDGYRHVVVNQERSIYRSDYGFLDPSFQYFYFELSNMTEEEATSFDFFFRPVSDLAFEIGRIDYFQFEPVFPIDNFFNPLITKPLTYEIDAFVGSSRLTAMSVSSVIVPYLYFTLDGVSQVVISDAGQWSNDSYRVLDDFGSMSPATRMFLYAHGNFVLTPPPSFLDRVTSGLTAVIGWVGAVASAVISGPLSPLLGLVAVGIAVSAILLVIYLVRRFIWGA